MKVNVAIIHGIGKTKPGYARDFILKVQRQFQQYLRKSLKTNSGFTAELAFREIVWDDILGKNQDELQLIFEKEFQRRTKEAQRTFFKRFLIFCILTALFFLLFKSWGWRLAFLLLALSLGFSKKALTILRTSFAALYINDIIGYRNKEAYASISQRIEEEISQLNKTKSKEPLTIIAHSLGTVISSDYIYDRQDRQGIFHANLTLWNFFTLGSPLALFALQYGPELFKSPIHLENKTGRWINILDADDVIAYPLRPLNDAYKEVVDKDVYVQTGLLGVSHIHYWTNKRVQEIIAKKLALDWLALNQKLSEDELKRLYEEWENPGNRSAQATRTQE